MNHRNYTLDSLIRLSQEEHRIVHAGYDEELSKQFQRIAEWMVFPIGGHEFAGKNELGEWRVHLDYIWWPSWQPDNIPRDP